MANQFQGDVDIQQLLLDVETKILKELKVASLGIVQNYNEDSKTCSVLLTPIQKNEDSNAVTAYVIDDEEEYAKNDKVLILFTDLDFTGILSSLKKENPTPKEVEGMMHKTKNAIIIKKINI